MTEAAFIAVDWGTTNRRAYMMSGEGTVLKTERDDRGLTAVEPGRFGEEAAAIRQRFGDLPILCAGMVGSVRGWADAGYRPCPVTIDDLARQLCWVEPGRTAIVSGASHVDGQRGDVMRGEEVQLLGAVAAGLAPADSLLCQPGTHCKWAYMAGGRLERFRTTVTGELFALLRRHSLLADYLGGDVRPGAAFDAGLAAADEGALLGNLFGERASALLDLRDKADIAAHASGLLIGTDVREQRLTPGQNVQVLADPGLGDLYCAAIRYFGANAERIDSHAAFAAGIARIWSLAR
ncbi:2-dehydro-3-deoxygalactonokinase [Stakelama sp. CBK3Z-3]|uniref:2-dehydro-3-deoxygalactonokinase n=1 Tax=Stakelama flava TaxID=2860338 RepID=A0ABS6XJC3_9SPHN|nr:2-dehydro-3-deoxygalactonokinase [Stakelama flava]MBW4330295.1 2-dehydro-3-deoxygalactonokinase [Stakelama flava]